MGGSVDPPSVDPLAVDDSLDITPRDFEELVAPVMEMRDCSSTDAERYINDHGRVQVERELYARWSSGKWGNTDSE